MKEQSAELRKVQNEFRAMTQVMQAFTILAPEPGMVIYTKGPGMVSRSKPVRRLICGIQQ